VYEVVIKQNTCCQYQFCHANRQKPSDRLPAARDFSPRDSFMSLAQAIHSLRGEFFVDALVIFLRCVSFVPEREKRRLEESGRRRPSWCKVDR
jgi:hypothetical protein